MKCNNGGDISIKILPIYDAIGRQCGINLYVRTANFAENLKILNEVYFEESLTSWMKPSDYKALANFINSKYEEIFCDFPGSLILLKSVSETGNYSIAPHGDGKDSILLLAANAAN